jgi:TolA-binding protein
MAESLEKQIEELRAERDAALAANEKIKLQASEIEVSAEAERVRIEELTEAIKSTQARVAELEDALQTSSQALQAAKDEMKSMKDKETMRKREAALIEAGLEADEVAESLISLANLDEPTFDCVVAMYKKKAKFVPFKKDEDKDKPTAETVVSADDGADQNDLTPEALEGLETSEAALIVPRAEDDLEIARASISEWFEKQVLNK